MKVKLISSTQPALEFGGEDVTTAQDLIAFTARVSNPANQMNKETSEKLLKYLIKHKHWSPFEMVSACIEIETTRDIAHQIVRHRSFSFQEFSQRYAEPSLLADKEGMEDAHFTIREARLQDKKNRQNSVATDDMELDAWWIEHQRNVIKAAQNAYDWAIRNGIAKEQARVVLPEGLTKTRLYMNGTLRSWIHYIELRSANGTQKEHMDIAIACAQIITELVPMTKVVDNPDNSNPIHRI
jgi:thymidylate synthase (FAD)